jgi:hypothetical protein
MEGDIEDAEGMETERRHALLAQLQNEQHEKQAQRQHQSQQKAAAHKQLANK